MTVAIIALSCIASFVAGVLWREAFELLRGKDTPMALWRRLRAVHVNLLTASLVASLVLVALVGTTLVVTENQRADLVACLTDYNARQGQARDERAAATEQAARAELAYVREDLAYQRGLEDTLTTGADTRQLLDTIRTRIGANEAYLADLQDLQRVRTTTDYPPADLCEDPQ